MSTNLSGRRKFLTFLAAAAACPICASVVRADTSGAPAHGAAGGASKPHWSYSGEGGPDRWGRLEPNFRSCDLGMEQTPIDLKGAIRTQVGGLDVSFKEAPFKIVNNGHTIQVNCAEGSQTRINGVAYDLLQFHFHHPSEHLLAGKGFDLECHFVHRSAAGDLAVLGVFIRPGEESAALRPIWSAMPTTEGPERPGGGVIRPSDLLPRDRSYFRYAGSLTTPPCSEGITWTVFKESVEASPAQIRQFAQLFPNNARPIQGVNRRFLLESF